MLMILLYLWVFSCCSILYGCIGVLVSVVRMVSVSGDGWFVDMNS